MTKKAFLAELRKKLAGIPQDDMEERINFYGEMIDDRMEEGLAEEDAVAELGAIEDITAQIMAEIPLAKLVKEKVKPGRALRVWEIVLMVLGSPIWLSLLIAFFAIVLAAYIVVWSLIISVWAVELSFAACALAGVLGAAVFAVQGNILPGIAMLGMGISCAGLAIFGNFGCKYATMALLNLTKKVFVWIKSCFIKKEATE